MRKSRVEKAREAASAGKVIEPVETDLKGLAALVVSDKRQILPTQEEFIFSPHRVKWYVGPVGCAKTTTGCGSVIVPAMLYPGSRWLIARWTYGALEQTTMKRFDECLRRLGPSVIVDEIKGPPRSVYIASALRTPDGKPAEPSEIVFGSLDEETKLGSQEFTGILVDEANEIEKTMAETLNSRLRHKLPGQERAIGPFFLNLVSNPTNKNHWLHKGFCREAGCDPDPFGVKFRPKPRENIDNLPPGYYDTISVGMSPEMKTRMVEGECGSDPGGNPVYKGSWNGRIHVGDLLYYPHLPMGRTWDFGRRRPAITFWQPLPDSCVNFLYAELGENETTEQFAKRVLQTGGVYFRGINKWIDFCDPAGAQKKSNSEESDVDILRKMGINVQYRDTLVKTGIDLVTKGLNTLVKGRPQYMFDRRGCEYLIDGFASGYTYALDRAGKELKEEPVKDGYYDHGMDTVRYTAVNLILGSTLSAEHHLPSLRVIRGTLTGN